MAKNKKISEKRKQQKLFVTRAAKKYAPDLLMNRIDFVAEMKAEANIRPFKFVVTISDNPSINILSVNVNGVIADGDKLKKADSKITCEIEAIVATLTFLLIIRAKGTPGTNTPFNLTCDGQKVFNTDQQITMPGTNGGFSNPTVPLP